MESNEAKTEAPQSRRKWIVWTGVLGLWAVCTLKLGLVLFGTNFHAVVPGQFYRSSQPSDARVDQYVKDYGIRTIVNMRGFGEPADWHVEEARATHRNGISQEDLTFSAGQLPSTQELRKLIRVIEESPKPVLFHCFRGVDRTGLAATTTRLLLTDSTLEEATEELSWQYGHLAFGQTGYIDRFFDLYKEWLRGNGLTHSNQRFRDWAMNKYIPDACHCELRVLDYVEESLEPRAGKPFGFQVQAKNISLRAWQFSPTQTAGFHLHWELYRNDHRILEGRAGLFEKTIHPGQSIDLTVVIPAVDAGDYILQIDMVEEQHCFFRHTGSEPLQLSMRVREKD